VSTPGKPDTQAQPPGNSKKWLSRAIRLLVGGGFLIFVFRTISLDDIVRTLASTNLMLAFGVILVAWFDRALMAYKWNLLLRPGGLHITHVEAIRLFFIGSLLGTVTPGSIGADAYRVAALAHLGKSGAVISTVLLERFIGLAVIFTFAAFGLFVSLQDVVRESPLLLWFVIIGAVGTTALVIVSFRRDFVEGIGRKIPFFRGSRIATVLRDFYRVYAESRRNPGLLLYFTALTALEALAIIFMHFLAARAVHIDVSFFYFLCVIPLVVVLVRLPISFHGFGVFEGALAYFLVLRGFTVADGISIALLMRVIEVMAIFIPAAIMLWIKPLKVDGQLQ